MTKQMWSNITTVKSEWRIFMCCIVPCNFFCDFWNYFKKKREERERERERVQSQIHHYKMATWIPDYKQQAPGFIFIPLNAIYKGHI